jgi:hypothetical protein
MTHARDAYIAHTPWLSIPEGKLILLCDALLQTFEGVIWTMYVFFVRPLHGDQAVILPPFFRQGRETSRGGWTSAFATIPADVKKRICALVCDGAHGARREAWKADWVLQRCHFHLLISIANYVRPGPLSRHKNLASEIYPRVRVLLYERDREVVERSLHELEIVVLPLIRTRKLRMILFGFLKNYEEYRAYLLYPAYALPTTTSSAESFFSRVRRLLFWTRGFRTPDAFCKWFEAFCKKEKTITYNGKSPQN